MKYRRFGRTGWQVSEMGYGMWGMAGWTGSEDEESLASLQRAIDLGCNFFDTAWGYGEGHSENLLGQIVRANPGRQLFAATKIPPKNLKWPSRREFTLDDCFPPDHIESYIHKSLDNLGLPHIDLIQFHTWEDSWVSDDRWAKKINELKGQGLIKAVGIDPIHFGVVIVLNLMIALITPPVGLNLFISSYRFEKPILHVYSATFPFLMILLLSVILIAFWPDLSLWLVPDS